MTRDALEQNQVPIYFVAVIVAAIGGLLAPNTAQGLSVLVTPTIAVLMYAMFLQIPFLNLKDGMRNKPFMAALLVANFCFDSSPGLGADPLLGWTSRHPDWRAIGVTDALHRLRGCVHPHWPG